MPDEISFFDKVYAQVQLIPAGRVSTFGAIARKIGSPQSARMVGYALNALQDRDDVPAHRVVNRKGMLTGKHHFQGTNLMQQLLENEGVIVKNNQVMDFDKLFWQP